MDMDKKIKSYQLRKLAQKLSKDHTRSELIELLGKHRIKLHGSVTGGSKLQLLHSSLKIAPQITIDRLSSRTETKSAKNANPLRTYTPFLRVVKLRPSSTLDITATR